jgi:purine-binding chemotaxis protein CheW
VTLEVLVFALDEGRYAIPLDRVVEAARRVRITPLAAAPDAVLGLIVHRGEPVPAIDMRSRLGRSARAPALADHFLVARTARRLVALVVDQILTTRVLSLADVHPLAVTDPQIAGVAVVDDDLWMIEDLDALLSLDEESALERALGAVSS